MNRRNFLTALTGTSIVGMMGLKEGKLVEIGYKNIPVYSNAAGTGKPIGKTVTMHFKNGSIIADMEIDDSFVIIEKSGFKRTV